MPIQIKANNVPEKIQYTDTLSPQNTLYFTDSDAFETAWARALTTEQITPSAHHATSSSHKSCVEIAKEYLGIYGTWGNGARLLSLNSGPVVNAVVVFTYTHAGIVQAVANGQILLYEGNYDLKGSIRTRWMSITDPTIRGYHHF